ncbi:MAG TPA: threonine--tRNA ligase [Candidatus Caccopulliclostridium gallistercoris]|uniref:Threonine--tRNA ligase n=1 Tax=Candidatus Caccopulliclostridium gallistercoris TaxID=2840719 RepID=A0A9D1NF30_9FIRM|nr:threonine--tRNA ligase [Candidatus Caccopulliclostridium gallistercoris]
MEKVKDEKQELELTMRHTMAHVLAAAIKELYGKDVKFGIGPAIENGFYYDFDLDESILPEHFDKIEEKMKEIIAGNYDMTKKVISKQQALDMFKGQPYKVELINDLPEGEEISIYELGDKFTDLCRGPHVENTKFLRSFAFKINRVSGAYWRGNEKNKMMQRVYVLGFQEKQALKDYVHMLEEAAKRDHRKLGKDLGLYFISDYAKGMPFYEPKGMIIKNELISFWREKHQKAGYVEIETPIAMNRKLWEVSGHWDHYKQNMYTFKVDEEEFAIKPMNCPGGMLYYKENVHSYKDLPLRVGELGKVHRHEASGTLHGLFRVRCFTQDDAHIFMLPSQIEDEIKNVLSLVDDIYSVFGLTYHLELSTMPENHIGDVKDWEVAEAGLKNALDHIGRDYYINEGDGAFYGPKIDIHIKDAIGRTWQCGTIQLDMQLPKRFNLEYIDENGEKKEPVMIHRVIYGSIDRFFGIITENFAGAFPVWLAPVQVKILPISEKFIDKCNEVKAELEKYGIRIEVDDRDEKIGYKIRSAASMKIPYMIIIGEEEINSNTISLRGRRNENVSGLKLEDFIQRIRKEIKDKDLN